MEVSLINVDDMLRDMEPGMSDGHPPIYDEAPKTVDQRIMASDKIAFFTVFPSQDGIPIRLMNEFPKGIGGRITLWGANYLLGSNPGDFNGIPTSITIGSAQLFTQSTFTPQYISTSAPYLVLNTRAAIYVATNNVANPSVVTCIVELYHAYA